MISLRYVLLDPILHLAFAALVIGTLIPALFAARAALHRLSFRARSRVPFGAAALILAGCAALYGRATFASLAEAWQRALAAGSILSTARQLATGYAVFAGFISIATPAVVLARIWWDFQRRGPEATMARDLREPVLLLRSFEGDESEEAKGPARTLERALHATIDRSVGPLIALGSPKDFSPPSGARRTYIAGDDWRPKVSGYIDRAVAIIFVVSRWTGPIAWELQEVRARFKPERTLLVVPSGADGFGNAATTTFEIERRVALLSALGVPDAGEGPLAPGSDGSLLIGYRADWTPVVLRRDFVDARSLVDEIATRLTGARESLTAPGCRSA